MSASGAVGTPARLTVLSGPSGVGKGTVVAALRRLAPRAWISVSCTTRPPRPGETEGREYRFVSRTEFDRLVAAGEMLEWAEFAGNRYGTPREPVLEHIAAGTPTVLEIELQGARQVRAAMPNAQFVFLAPPSLPALVERLAHRGTDTPQAQAERLRIAQVELAAAAEFDRIVVNDEVHRAAADLAALL